MTRFKVKRRGLGVLAASTTSSIKTSSKFTTLNLQVLVLFLFSLFSAVPLFGSILALSVALSEDSVLKLKTMSIVLNGAYMFVCSY